MTNNLTLRTLDLPAMHRFGIGFESMFDNLLRNAEQKHNPTQYPLYNLIQVDTDHFIVELAISGFKESDINVQLENNQLIITGTHTKTTTDPEPEYLVRGISAKPFNRSFTLAEHIVVNSATVEDGILSINLERVMPEEKKPRKIPIVRK